MPNTNPLIQAFFDRIEQKVLPPFAVMRVLRSTKEGFVYIEEAGFANKAEHKNWCERHQKRRASYLRNGLGWKDQVILTTSQSVSVFCNPEFLTDTTPMPEAMECHDNSATKLHQSCALYLGMAVFYDPAGITNLVAFNNLVQRGYKISFKNNKFTAVWPYAKAHSLHFENQSGVYVLVDSQSTKSASLSASESPISYVSHVENIPAERN